MAARTRNSALRDYVDSIADQVGSVTQVRVGAFRSTGADEETAVLLNRGDPVRIRGSERWLTITIQQQIRLVNQGDSSPFVAEITKYNYGLDLAEGLEVLSYHWHPEGDYSAPHLHFKAGATTGQLLAEFSQSHMPTGQVSPGDFLALLIETFGVRPLVRDWRARLAAGP